jgi:hypothetical protein
VNRNPAGGRLQYRKRQYTDIVDWVVARIAVVVVFVGGWRSHSGQNRDNCKHSIEETHSRVARVVTQSWLCRLSKESWRFVGCTTYRCESLHPCNYTRRTRLTMKLPEKSNAEFGGASISLINGQAPGLVFQGISTVEVQFLDFPWMKSLSRSLV